LFSLLSKYIEFVWAETCQHALDELKLKVSEDPILRGHDWTIPFHISINTYNMDIGVVFGQLKGKDPYAI
jgi:hypothetical protein